MLFDLRTYRCRPGTMSAQLQNYARDGYATQTGHLGVPIFYGTVETGDTNAYVHLWQFQDAADRERRRAKLYADKDWLSYRRNSAQHGYQTEQVNILLKPAWFWEQSLPTNKSEDGM